MQKTWFSSSSSSSPPLWLVQNGAPRVVGFSVAVHWPDVLSYPRFLVYITRLKTDRLSQVLAEKKSYTINNRAIKDWPTNRQQNNKTKHESSGLNRIVFQLSNTTQSLTTKHLRRFFLNAKRDLILRRYLMMTTFSQTHLNWRNQITTLDRSSQKNKS